MSQSNGFYFNKRPKSSKHPEGVVIMYYLFEGKQYVVTTLTPQEYMRLPREEANLLGLRWLSRQRRAGNLKSLRP